MDTNNKSHPDLSNSKKDAKNEITSTVEPKKDEPVLSSNSTKSFQSGSNVSEGFKLVREESTGKIIKLLTSPPSNKSIPKIDIKNVKTNGVAPTIDSLRTENSLERKKNAENQRLSESKKSLKDKLSSVAKKITNNTKSSEKLIKSTKKTGSITFYAIPDPSMAYFELSAPDEEQKYEFLFRKYKSMICDRNNHCESYVIDQLSELIELDDGGNKSRTMATFYLNNIAWFVQLKCTQDASDHDRYYLGIYLYAGDTSPFIVDWSCETVGYVILHYQNPKMIKQKPKKSDELPKKTENCKFRPFSHKFKRNTGFQIPNFIRLDELKNPDNHFIRDDYIQITFVLSADKPIINFTKDMYSILNQNYIADKYSDAYSDAGKKARKFS